MAHITEFTVEGLAGRKDLVSEKLDRYVNVFFGQNGSGKTSLLKILHSAMSSDPLLLTNVPFTRAEVKIYSLTYDKVFVRVCDKKQTQLELPSDEPRNLAESISAAGPVGSANPTEIDLKWRDTGPAMPKGLRSWAHRYLPTARLYLSDRIRARAGTTNLGGGPNEDQLEEAFAELVNSVWSSYSAGVLGLIQRAQAEGLADILKSILSGTEALGQDAQLDPGSAYQSVARFLERQGSKAILGNLATFESNYSKNLQLRSVVSDINKVELKIQEAVAPREKLKSTIEKMFSGNKKVVFKEASIEIVGAEEKQIGLARLSSGEKQLLRILIDVLLAAANSFILDEPEISMHVDWQHNLIGVMRQLGPEAQLVLATHSPEIMADIKDQNIFRI